LDGGVFGFCRKRSKNAWDFVFYLIIIKKNACISACFTALYVFFNQKELGTLVAI